MADTLRDAVSSASAELNTDSGNDRRETETTRESREARTERDVPRETSEHDDDNVPNAPKWLNGTWSKKAKLAAKQLHSYEGADDALKTFYDEIQGKYNENKSGKKEFDTYRSRFSRYENFLPQLEQTFALRGQDPVAGIQQLVSYQQMLQNDPDQGFALLAQQLRPRDAKALFQNLARQWGVDVSQVVQNQPWIDPAVQQLVEPLQQQNQQLMQYLQNQHQMQYQAASHQVGTSIKAFIEAKDENGDPKYPHYQRLEARMAQLVNTSGIRPLEELYNDAIWQDPELREEAIKAHAKATAPKVIEDTHRTNAIAETAKRASRNVNGGTRTPTTKPSADLRDVIRQERKRLEAR